jgi:hypothetical protein
MKHKNKVIIMAGMLFCFCLTTFAQGITLNLNNVSVKNAFETLRDEHGYLFVYESGDVNTRKVVSVNAQNQTLDAVLGQILQGQDVAYEVSEKNVVVRKSASVQPQATAQQTRRIAGTVVDVNDEPIIGANIMEKGTTNGTVTDVDGKFALTVAANAVLHVSYIGYIAQEINALTTGGGHSRNQAVRGHAGAGRNRSCRLRYAAQVRRNRLDFRSHRGRYSEIVFIQCPGRSEG